MVSASTTFTPESTKRFAELLRETAAVTGRDVRLQVKLNGRDYVKKAMSLTPMMKANQPRMVNLSDLPPVLRSFFSALGYKVVPASVLGWEPFKARGRGFARSGWLVALFGLGLRTKVTPGMMTGGQWREVGEFRDRLKAALPSVEVGNAVPFIETLNAQGGNDGQAHFYQTAIDKTVRQMEYRLNYFAWKVSQRFGSGARMPKTFHRDQ